MKLKDFIGLLDDLQFQDSSNGHEIFLLEELIESKTKDIFVPIRHNFKNQIINIIGKKEESDNQVKLNKFSGFYLKIVSDTIDKYKLNYNESGLILAINTQLPDLKFVVEFITKYPDNAYYRQNAAYALKKVQLGTKLSLVDKLNYKAHCKHFLNQLNDYTGEYEYQLSLLVGEERQILIEKTNSIEDLLVTALRKLGFDIQLDDKPPSYWNEYPVTSYSVLKQNKSKPS